MAIAVLVIDDNQDQIVITRKVLAKSGGDYSVDSAASAKEGIEKIKSVPCDIVLCDYRLPDLTGIEILKQFKESGNDRPFILVTSMGNERLAAEAMKSGAYDYVVKDASYETILPEVIRQSLERYQEKKSLERLEVERNEAVAVLRKERSELETMNKMMLNRESRILELKQEVNTLLKRLGEPPRYGGYSEK